MDNKTFDCIVDKIVKKLHKLKDTNPKMITDCDSDAFEHLVLNVVKDTVSTIDPSAKIVHTSGGHQFPDIVIIFSDNNKYGIEVKSSTSKSKTWKINGNSILGTTSISDVIKTYIIFGKIVPNFVDFKARPYEECIEDIVVTHSPRYFINMELQPDETFFFRSNIPYQAMKDSSDPIGLMTQYYRAKGHRAWWISDNTPAALRMFDQIEISEQQKLVAHGLVHFPELFSNSQKKYKNFAMWLVAERSVITLNLRDYFSAGGTKNLTINGNLYPNLPQIFYRLNKNKNDIIRELDSANPDELASDWCSTIPINNDLKSKLQAWINTVVTYAYNAPPTEGLRLQDFLNDLFSDILNRNN